MKHYEEQTLMTLSLSDADAAVEQYLLRNPRFFIHNTQLLEQMHVPHPVREGVISLVEWKIALQRHKIQKLEEHISGMSEQARKNEILFNNLLTLQIDLAQANTLDRMSHSLQQWAQKLGLISANIRLFCDQYQLSDNTNCRSFTLSRAAFAPLRQRYLQHERHFLGQLDEAELRLLLMPKELTSPQTASLQEVPLPRLAAQGGSVALSLLGTEEKDLGLIIFTSADSQHYQRGMGTLILNQLVKLLPPLLLRCIKPLYENKLQ